MTTLGSATPGPAGPGGGRAETGGPLAKSPVTPSSSPAPSSSAAPSTSDSPTPTPSSEAPPTSSSPPPSSPKPSPKAEVDTSLAGQIVSLVNDQRADAGCDPVTEEPHLDTAAQKHSDDMSDRDYFSHDTPEGTQFDKRIRAAGYSKPGAENIAKGATSASQVMDMWMHSSGHRANILNCSLTKLGVGVAKAGWYWTQDFGY
ncbi:CAP domain-containing protein [Amycolatopsis sp. PS_44_ISF1]|nr:CAP domain-containing protein [Amycolatopsis sp. PS_44_ISF1]MDT8910589.1 CAP domain-containing protein [Amycolatopsis sp. PS_44_ISF1]